MDKKIGFIGCGNMGKAILGGLIASGQVQPGQIWVYTPVAGQGCSSARPVWHQRRQQRQEVAQIADIVFGAVKPGIMTKVLGDIASSLSKAVAGGLLSPPALRLSSWRAPLATIAKSFARCRIRRRWLTPVLTSVTPNALVSSEDVAE
ncbi:NAD(P)-binding domain-containing protein [Klebsiella pneumoniae subsp. pneumoniae]|nr:NAD(P)-binding domain-containing protein [Klebsiella pneumoniae subsp. pneumoniae]